MNSSHATTKISDILVALKISDRGNLYEPLARTLLAEAYLDVGDTGNAIVQVGVVNNLLSQKVTTGNLEYDKMYDKVLGVFGKTRSDSMYITGTVMAQKILFKLTKRIEQTGGGNPETQGQALNR